MVVHNITTGNILAKRCRKAHTFLSRLRGLLGTAKLEEGSGLWLYPCNSIHMFFMKYSLDIIFISAENTVVYTVENLQPWKFTEIVPGAKSVLELPAGTIRKTSTYIGDKLEFVE